MDGLRTKSSPYGNGFSTVLRRNPVFNVMMFV